MLSVTCQFTHKECRTLHFYDHDVNVAVGLRRTIQPSIRPTCMHVRRCAVCLYSRPYTCRSSEQLKVIKSLHSNNRRSAHCALNKDVPYKPGAYPACTPRHCVRGYGEVRLRMFALPEVCWFQIVKSRCSRLLTI